MVSEYIFPTYRGLRKGIILPSIFLTVSLFSFAPSVWYLFTGLLLTVIFFFGYTLSVIIKQRQLSQVQKDFINNLTHELKTPISSIALSAKVIADKKILQRPDRLSEYARIIQEQNERMSKNVEKVLNLASLEKNRIYLNKEKISPEQFLEKIVENFRHTDAGARAKIEIIRTVEEINIYADKFHFTNLVLNILENSVKYCENSRT